MLDEHTSHCSSSVLHQIVKKKETVMLILTIHTTAVLQPLGRGNAGLFKTCLQQLLTAGSTPIKLENEHEVDLEI